MSAGHLAIGATTASTAEWLRACDTMVMLEDTLAMMKLYMVREVGSLNTDRGTIVGRVFSPTIQLGTIVG